MFSEVEREEGKMLSEDERGVGKMILPKNTFLYNFLYNYGGTIWSIWPTQPFRGKKTCAVVPWPGRDLICRVPPWSSMMRRAMGSPKPLPSGRVV